jgi:Flp pilus assembly protein TadD
VSGIRIEYGSSSTRTAEPFDLPSESSLQLERAEQLRLQGLLDQAQKICESLLRRHPDYFGAAHTLGLVHIERRNYQRALDSLVRAVMLNPRSWTSLTALGQVYLRLGATEMAAHVLEQARAIQPQDADILKALGAIYADEREYELARDAYVEALALDDTSVAAAHGLGLVYSFIGEDAEAARLLERLVERGSPPIEVLLALANLPASLVSVDVQAQMRKIACDPGEDKVKFENLAAFTRAAALDQAGHHAEAWKEAAAANRRVFDAMRESWFKDVERQRASLASLVDTLQMEPPGDEAALPISLFVLGPSRSGKTTMERLVNALPGVKRGYENPIVENAVRRTFYTAGLLADRFENLPRELDSLCSEIYLEELARRAGSARLFTNTTPDHIHDAARIAATFPNARFLLVKRDVDHVLVRVYLRYYESGNAYAYDLRAARDHVVWYYEMMDLLAKRLPNAVRIVRYEDMAADPAAALRVAADLCGLPMTDRALPAIGDYCECATPYGEFMAAEQIDED